MRSKQNVFIPRKCKSLHTYVWFYRSMKTLMTQNIKMLPREYQNYQEILCYIYYDSQYENHRQKVVNRGIYVRAGGVDIQNWQKFHWIIVFQISIKGGLELCLGRLSLSPPKPPRGGGTGQYLRHLTVSAERRSSNNFIILPERSSRPFRLTFTSGAGIISVPHGDAGDEVASPMLENWPLCGQNFWTFGQIMQLHSQLSEAVTMLP